MIDLKSLRKDFGMTQSDMARVMGVSIGRAANIERNIWPIDECEIIRLIGQFGYSVVNYIHEGLSLREVVDNRRKLMREERHIRHEKAA